jgi:hypothetical protein
VSAPPRLRGARFAAFALGALGALGALAGCTAHGTASRSERWGSRPVPVVIEEVPVNGFEVTVVTDDDSFTGELLAVDPCFAHVLKDGRTVSIPSSSVQYVRVQLYPASTAGGVAALTFFGSISTISHGWFLVFSFPIWLSTGIATSVNLAYADDVKVKDGNLLFQFARFPQGLPRGWRADDAMPGASPACPAPQPSSP